MDPDDDLLQPTLTRADDAIGFDAPWNPSWITFAVFFGGFLAGGWLMAENWRKLGHPEKSNPLFFACIAVWLVTSVALAWLQLRGWPGLYVAGDNEHRRIAKLAVQLASLAVALAVASRQQPRWKLYAAHGGEHAPLFKTALGAILAATVAQIVIVGLAAAWFVATP